MGLAIAKLSDSTSLFIAEPAATIDASPIFSGAIREAFEPIKTLSPTIVRFLFFPS